MCELNINNIKTQKAEIRKEILGILRSQDHASRSERSRRIQDKFLSSDEYRASKVILAYVSMASEVDTSYIIERSLEDGKKVAVPYIDTLNQEIVASELISIDNLVDGPYGTKEPQNGPARAIEFEEIELIVIPAIAYDRNNMRLGRGKGYYDRFLSDERLSSSKKIGLAFHFQVVDLLPSDPHDVPVTRVITD